jgi:hypothetical protein
VRAGTLQRYVHRKCLARLWRAFSGMCIVGAAGENAHFAAAFARIECHYFINKVGFVCNAKRVPLSHCGFACHAVAALVEAQRLPLVRCAVVRVSFPPMSGSWKTPIGSNTSLPSLSKAGSEASLRSSLQSLSSENAQWNPVRPIRDLYTIIAG